MSKVQMISKEKSRVVGMVDGITRKFWSHLISLGCVLRLNVYVLRELARSRLMGIRREHSLILSWGMVEERDEEGVCQIPLTSAA